MTRRVHVFVQDSDESRKAWQWALDNTVRAGDHVSLVTVAGADVPVMGIGSGAGMLGSPSALAAELEAIEYAKEESKQKAQELLQQFKEMAKPEDWTIDMHVLLQQGKSIGETACEYLRHHHADEAIVGQRDIGAFKKSMLALVGKGSVSDHIVHHAPCSVIVVRKHEEEAARSTV